MRTIIDKIWDAHVVSAADGRPGAHLHRPAPGPRGDLAAGVRRPPRARACACAARTGRSRRSTTASRRRRPACRSPTRSRRGRWRGSRRTARSSASRCAGRGHPSQGIVHVIGPELGLTQPGMTIVCGDSHTATHGAFGALAFGIGTSEVEMVLATQCLLQRRPKTLRDRRRRARWPPACPPRT